MKQAEPPTKKKEKKKKKKTSDGKVGVILTIFIKTIFVVFLYVDVMTAVGWPSLTLKGLLHNEKTKI